MQALCSATTCDSNKLTWHLSLIVLRWFVYFIFFLYKKNIYWIDMYWNPHPCWLLGQFRFALYTTVWLLFYHFPGKEIKSPSFLFLLSHVSQQCNWRIGAEDIGAWQRNVCIATSNKLIRYWNTIYLSPSDDTLIRYSFEDSEAKSRCYRRTCIRCLRQHVSQYTYRYCLYRRQRKNRFISERIA